MDCVLLGYSDWEDRHCLLDSLVSVQLSKIDSDHDEVKLLITCVSFIDVVWKVATHKLKTSWSE